MERQKDEERTRFWKQNKVVWLVPYNHEKHVKKNSFTCVLQRYKAGYQIVAGITKAIVFNFKFARLNRRLETGHSGSLL